jgi:hypothetical protein
MFDECLKKLESELGNYLKSIGKFQVATEEAGGYWRVSKHEFSSRRHKCQLCGHFPIKELFFITCDSLGKTLCIGNVCVTKYTNPKIVRWFKAWHRRKERLLANQEIMRQLETLIGLYASGRSPIYISRIGYKRLVKMLGRLCKGLNPRKSQQRLLDYYWRKYRRVVSNQ